MVGRAHRALVVLDHDHRVAEVAQALERRDQPRVVALVQPDRRLVEDVEHADERRADLGGQPDALRLAARQRRRRPLQRQVADADVVEEAAAAPRSRAGSAARSARSASDSSSSSSHSSARRRRAARELVDRHRRHGHGARLGPQPRAAALRARPHRHVLLDLLARVVGVGLAVAPLEVGDDALEARRVGALAPVAVAVGDVDPVAVRAVAGRGRAAPPAAPPTACQVDLVALGDRLR